MACEVYALLNASDEIIYIGSTSRGVLTRYREHLRPGEHRWTDEITDVRVLANCASIKWMVAMEGYLIGTLTPRHNVQWNPRRPPPDPSQLVEFEQRWGLEPGSSFHDWGGIIKLHRDPRHLEA